MASRQDLIKEIDNLAMIQVNQTIGNQASPELPELELRIRVLYQEVLPQLNQMHIQLYNILSRLNGPALVSEGTQPQSYDDVNHLAKLNICIGDLRKFCEETGPIVDQLAKLI